MKRTTLYIIPALALASCDPVGITEHYGDQPDRDIITETPAIFLRTEQSPDNTVHLTFNYGEGNTIEIIRVTSNRPLDETCTVSLASAGEAAVEEYGKAHGTEYRLLPEQFYTFINGNSIDIHENTQESAYKQLRIYAKNTSDAILAPGRYLLPLVGTASKKDMEDDTLWIEIDVREKYTDPDGFELYTGEDMFTVFYLNTSQFDPRLANDMILMTNYADVEAPQYGIGNIVNLRTASVQYDEATGQVSVRPSIDLRYVLDHYTERVLPVQESGRKVCICIEGGGKGIGFCNFTDGQIAEFAASVKRMVDTYGLDGINLWDRDSGYGRAEENGFPKMNTTSYPKLIKALRNTLGPDKLLTLTDYEEPTAYFHDAAACGGIEVGKLIDYAWSGYCDGRKPVQIVDPWHPDAAMVSKLHPRTPIAGLDKKYYGCIHATWYIGYEEASADIVTEWVKAGLNPSGITVYYDIRSIIQDQFETGGHNNPYYILGYWYDSVRYSYNSYRLQNNASQPNYVGNQYNKWVKDW